jgi:hypothetical protein
VSTTPSTHIDLLIDVFCARAQRAQVLASLRPPDLVAAIIAEFHGDEDLLMLDTQVERYYLMRAHDGTPLADEQSLESQRVAPGERLVLVERMPPLPAGTVRPQRRIYLRHLPSARVYRPYWFPALIGRRSSQIADPGLAVNLAAFPNGDWVSRRHAQVSERDGQVVLVNLAEDNPVALRAPDGGETLLASGARGSIGHKHTIVFVRSGIELQLLIADEVQVQQRDTSHAN